jgi:hypothetical protein
MWIEDVKASQSARAGSEETKDAGKKVSEASTLA